MHPQKVLKSATQYVFLYVQICAIYFLENFLLGLVKNILFGNKFFFSNKQSFALEKPDLCLTVKMLSKTKKRDIHSQETKFCANLFVPQNAVAQFIEY